jgi:hypothetical protein
MTGNLGDRHEGYETRKAHDVVGVSATPEVSEFPCGGIVMEHEVTVPTVVSRDHDCAPPIIVVLPVLLAEAIRQDFGNSTYGDSEVLALVQNKVATGSETHGLLQNRG